MDKNTENRNVNFNSAGDSVFALLCDCTLSACKLDSFSAGTFSEKGNRWLELAIAWEKLLEDGSAGIFLDAVHRIMWGLPVRKSRPEYESIVCTVKDELLRDGEAFAAWDTYVACDVAITTVGDNMDPLIDEDREYRYSIEHYHYLCDRMLWKIRYSKAKYVTSASQYREACCAYEEAIKKIIPVATTWDEDYWCNENHIHDEIANVYGIDYRDDFLEYGRILLLLMGLDDDTYGLKEAWFATNIGRLPMSLAKVIWPLNTKDKIMQLFYIAAEATEALVGADEWFELKKERELHPVGVFEYSSLHSSWFYTLISDWIDGMDSTDEAVHDMKQKLFTIAMNS